MSKLTPEDKAKYIRVSNELIDIMHEKHGLNPGECALVLKTLLELLNETGVYGAMFSPSERRAHP